MTQDQTLRNIEQCFELLEVGVLGDEQVFLAIQPEMNRCLRCPRHTYSPDYPTDLEVQHLVSFLTTQFLAYIRKDFLEVWDVEDVEIVVGQPSFGESVLYLRDQFSRCSVRVFSFRSFTFCAIGPNAGKI